MRCAWLLALAACAAPAAGGDAHERFAADGQRAFAAVSLGDGALVVGGRPAREGWAGIYDGSGARVALQRVGDDVAYAVAASADGAHAAIGMADGRVLLVALPQLQPVVELWRHARPVVAVAFTADGSTVASAGHDGVVRIGAARAGAVPTLLEHTAAVTCVAWSADDTLLLSGARDGKVRLHERSGRQLRSWNRLGGEVVSVRWRGPIAECAVRAKPVDAPVWRSLQWP